MIIINLGEGVVYGAFKSTQEIFNHALEELGIVEDEKTKLLRKADKLGKTDTLKMVNEINKINNISSAEDLLSYLDNIKKR